MSDNGGPAFPRHYGTSHHKERQEEGWTEEQLWSPGMSLLDYFAGQALVGLLAQTTHREPVWSAAWKIAQQMLESRQK